MLAAAQTPLFSNMSGGKGYAEREKYPYVFDAHAEAKQSSAFIGGAKVCSFTYSFKRALCVKAVDIRDLLLKTNHCPMIEVVRIQYSWMPEASNNHPRSTQNTIEEIIKTNLWSEK